jgi:hypothetical protein
VKAPAVFGGAPRSSGLDMRIRYAKRRACFVVEGNSGTRGVDRGRRSAAGIRVPWPAPRRDSGLERRDDLVSEFLIVVASLHGILAEVSHLAASSEPNCS